MLTGSPLLRPFLAGSLLLAGLASHPASAQGLRPRRGTILELGPMDHVPLQELRQDFSRKLKKDLDARADDFRNYTPEVVFQQMILQNLANAVPSRRVRYASADAKGNPRTYSGRVYLPTHKPGTAPTPLPLVIYQHATETRRTFTSYFGKGEESVFGALAAEAFKFAVAMPDGDGMGADPSPEKHAYCHGPTTSACLIDMIYAVRDGAPGMAVFDGENYVWDGRLFIVGYSEGGYIAMAAVKELSTNPAYKDLKLTGAACMGGPFHFATALRDLLKNGAPPYDKPYIPAYFLSAWSELFPQQVDFRAGINPVLLERGPRMPSGPDAGNIVDWMKGDLDGDAITPRMQVRLSGDPKVPVPARTILDEGWVREHVDNPRSALNRLFDANDLVGKWAPSVPVLLVHDPYDATVGFANTQAVYDEWRRLRANPLGIIRLAVGTRGSGHVGGAVLAIPTAFVWIASGMPRSLMDLAAGRMKEAVVNLLPEEIRQNASDALKAKDPNRALLPLSRLECKAGPGRGPVRLRFGDRLIVRGKIKLYTVSAEPMFAHQHRIPGGEGFTRFVKELKTLGDTFDLQPGTTYYMAVYPKMGTVALTLKFEGVGLREPSTINIKQVKNKIVYKKAPARFDVSSNFKDSVDTAAFETPEKEKPFIRLS